MELRHAVLMMNCRFEEGNVLCLEIQRVELTKSTC